MNIQEWSVVIGVVTSALLALAPWMFMVHAKLAVLSSQVSRLDAKVDKMVEADHERLPQCIQHQTALEEVRRRLESHEMQLTDINQRIQDL
jgi:hypothetical protein